MIEKIITKVCKYLDYLGSKVDDVFNFDFQGYPRLDKKKDEKKSKL